MNGTGNNLIDGLADTQFSPNTGITRADLMDKGLMGPNSAAKRAAVLQTLQLPEHLTTTGLLDALNLLLSREEFDAL